MLHTHSHPKYHYFRQDKRPRLGNLQPPQRFLGYRVSTAQALSHLPSHKLILRVRPRLTFTVLPTAHTVCVFVCISDYSHDQTKEMERALSTNEEEQRCMQSFCGET
jgi:hypothetical protein